ncbi:Hypothetical predicted protein [Olea europaea subsp. europaea]|uniref:Zinc-ribbon domain-containing protein n=2 Tax=Olea europaea subsp. europaea TaxID=158383 RepID=A0A8S0PE16_OLEEU|nr:Hypothetical predicted protein [Olea europaea subsp. europaea]
MYESGKVRLVRCPKCLNILPEVTDYSFYQCGGCGAALRAVDFTAQNKRVDLDKLSEKSEEEMVGGILEKFSGKCEQVNIAEKRIMDSSDGSASDLRSNISSSSRGERRTDNYGTSLMDKGKQGAVDSPVVEKPDNLRIAEDFEDLKMYNEDKNGLQRSEHMMDRRYGDRSRMERFLRGRRMDVEGTRYAASLYSDEGSFNRLRSNYAYEDQLKNKNEADEFNEVDGVGEDQAVLLRKMDELKDRVSQSAEDLDRGTLPRGSYVDSENWHPDSSLGMEMYSEDESRLQRSDGMMDRRNGERSRMEGFRRYRRMDVEDMRFASSTNSEDGPSDNKSSFNYDHEDRGRNKNGNDRFNRVGYVREDRTHLLRKLDGLNDHFSGSDEMVDKAKEKVSLDRRTIRQVPYAGFENWYSDRSLGMEIYNEDKSGSQGSERMMDPRNGERSRLKECWRDRRMDVEGMRNAESIYSSEGSSGNHSRSNYDYEGQMENDVYGFNKFGEDRDELMRTLDELKNQLSQSGGMVPLDRRTIHQDPYVGSEKRYSDSSSEMQSSHPDKQFGRPPRNHYAEPSVHKQEKGGHSFYPPRYVPIVIPIGSQMLGRDPSQRPTPFRRPPSHAYFSGEYMDRVETYPLNVSHHHPSCSCFHCHNKRQVSLPVPPTAFRNKQLSNLPENVVFNNYKPSSSFGPREYDPRAAIPPPLKSQNPQSQTRLPSDQNSEVNDLIHPRPPRLCPVSSGRICRPIAGGAPFVTCHNCFELLQLPKKVMSEGRNKNRIRCGECSTIIAFAVSNKKLVVFINVEEENTLAEVDDSHDVSKPGNSYVHGHLNQASTTFSSYDYDNPGYDFQSMDREPSSSSTGQASSSNFAEVKIPHTTSRSTSAAEEDENIIAIRKDPDSAELASKRNGPLPPDGSTIQDEVIPIKSTAEQNSMNSTSAATEIDILTNEYSNTGTSLESGEGSREGDRLRSNRAAESYYAGIMRKNSRYLIESNQPLEHEEANVTVNGHLIPDRLIKKAEKLAGPIHPGHYWYDYRAGFWGAMGGSCLGIIPPFIEEFNHPMPENCSGGNTSVFVNGRELHRKDLNLLGNRGLPIDRDRSYIIEISGRILDEDTGEELESLGKLAPTVEKARRGFGMRAPKVAA